MFSSFLMLLSRAKKSFAIVSVMLLVVAVVHCQKGRLSQSEAVALAEQFIAQNGYTELPPDKNKISYEAMEPSSNLEQMLQERHNTLERLAYGFRSGRKGGAAGWTVVFRYAHPIDRHATSTGRAVTMNLDGTEIRIEHVDFLLRYARRLK
jgi:hypothetical protein